MAQNLNNNQAAPLDAKEIRIWADGCYDVGHFGHANSLRQAKSLGGHLTVGVHSDAEIMKHKGRPLFNEVERYAMIRAMRWVDQVVEEAPYVTQLETLDQHGCHFCSHGNDITTDAHGNDTYQIVKDAGRYKEVERTLGVSTTDIIERMLRVGQVQESSEQGQAKVNDPNANTSPYTSGNTQFTLTTQKLNQFGSAKDISKFQRIILAYGPFDVFHPGHIEYLQFAKQQGDFLLVGVYSDPEVKGVMGNHYPIMTIHERLMSVLACRDVDDVIIGFPANKSQWTKILTEYRISAIVHPPSGGGLSLDGEFVPEGPHENVYMAADLQNPDEMTKGIVARVAERRAEFELRNAEKNKKEIEVIAAANERQRLDFNEVVDPIQINV